MDYVTRMLGVFFGVIFNELINKSCAGYKSSHGGMGGRIMLWAAITDGHITWQLTDDKVTQIRTRNFLSQL